MSNLEEKPKIRGDDLNHENRTTTDEAKTKEEARIASGALDILTINDQERGIMPEDSEDVKWNYLAGAYSRKLVLTGKVSGVEGQFTKEPICIIDFEGIRILIPSRQMFLEEWPEDEEIPMDCRIRIGRMLGATVDFILLGVDIRERAAVASRKMALLQRQAKYYATGRVKPGIRVACRVTGVGGNRISVEAVGVETTIPAIDLTWEWYADVADLFSAGDLVVAKVMDVIPNEETGRYAVKLSIKAATPNPDLPALRRLTKHSNYFGVVTGVHERVIFVRLQCGVNAKTTLYYSRQIPSKLDTVSFHVRKVDEESGVALGFISRIIKQHIRTR